MRSEDGSVVETYDSNRIRAGDFFLLSLWLQGQMVDLLTFAARPDLVGPFLEHPSTMPRDFVKERFRRQAESFAGIKDQFVEQFRELVRPSEEADLGYIAVVRNAIAHSHVSLARDYLLYRPTGGVRREAAILRDAELQPRDGAADPMIIKLTFDEPRYGAHIARVKRVDEECFARVSSHLGVTHSRIR